MIGGGGGGSPGPPPPPLATPMDEDDITIDDYVLNSNLEKIKPYYPNQKDLNDLIRDLDLTKSNAELLTSRLKQWNLLDNSVQITEQRKRHQSFSSFFTMQNAI